MLAIITADGDRYVLGRPVYVVDAPAGAIGCGAISPLSSGIAWRARDQETEGVCCGTVTGGWRKFSGCKCKSALLRSVYRSMSISGVAGRREVVARTLLL